jgi:hypothetical protein
MTPAQRDMLAQISRSSVNPHRTVQQAKGLLMAADGIANAEIAERLDVSRNTVLGWRARFELTERQKGRSCPPASACPICLSGRDCRRTGVWRDFRVIPGRWQRGQKVFPLRVR